MARGQATPIQHRRSDESQSLQTTTMPRDKLPSYVRLLFRFRSARPSTTSLEPASDALGQNPKHLEASRSIFSSRYRQNRHRQNDANFVFLQKTILVAHAPKALREGAKRLARRLALRFVAVSLDTNRFGGAERDRTADPLLAKQVLSQLSYSPISSIARASPGSAISASGNPTANPSSLNPHSQMQMVGPGRLELPTPRLSSVCSNQLSYGPIRGTGRRGFLSS